MRIAIFLFTLLVCFAGTGKAQTDTSKAARSAADTQLVITTRYLRENDSLLKATEAEKQALLQQIASLKSNNDQKKQELIDKLVNVERTDSIKKAQQLQRREGERIRVAEPAKADQYCVQRIKSVADRADIVCILYHITAGIQHLPLDQRHCRPPHYVDTRARESLAVRAFALSPRL